MKVKRPNAAIYFIVYILFYPFLKLMFRIKIDRSKFSAPKGPFIVLANHTSFMDFLIVMLALYPIRLNAIAAHKFFLYKPLNRFLPMMGCISKYLFEPDIRSIIGIKTVLKRGDKILLFPEGRCSTDGVYAGVHKSTGKLIKKLGVHVVSCYSVGSYKCMPFWRPGLRFGRIHVTLDNLFEPEQLTSMSVESINDAIDKRLGGIDVPPPREPLQTFGAKRLAVGLDNILYLCPRCKQEFKMVTSDCTISCTACGNAAVIDRDMNLNPTSGSELPASIHEWFVVQAKYELSQLDDDMKPIVVKAKVRVPASGAGAGMETCGEGLIKLDRSGWHFDGKLKGEQVNLFFPIDTVPALPIDPNDVFQIYSGGMFYMFEPENKKACIKYSLIGECAYWKFAVPVQMTPGEGAPFANDNEHDKCQELGVL